MKTDKYTKVVLTIIAVCLIAQVLHQVGFVQEARAETTLPRHGMQYGMVPLNEDGSVTVRLAPEMDEIDVNITSIDGWDVMGSALKVKVVQMPD